MSVKVEPKEKCHICNLELYNFGLFLHFEKEHKTKENEMKSQNSKDPKVICELCDKSLKNQSSFRNHLSKVHRNKKNAVKRHTSKPESCTICEKTYSSLSSLQIHMTNYHDKAQKKM